MGPTLGEIKTLESRRNLLLNEVSIPVSNKPGFEEVLERLLTGFDSILTL
jgi:hypothetical protein